DQRKERVGVAQDGAGRLLEQRDAGLARGARPGGKRRARRLGRGPRLLGRGLGRVADDRLVGGIHDRVLALRSDLPLASDQDPTLPHRFFPLLFLVRSKAPYGIDRRSARNEEPRGIEPGGSLACAESSSMERSSS